MTDLTSLDRLVAELAERYRPLAVAILREAIRLPADDVDRPVSEGGDPRSGLSNHEGPRLRFLRDTIVDVGAVDHADDVAFDAFGNLVWTVLDPFDGVAPEERRVVLFDGHSDTVAALRDQWRERLGGAVDPYLGVVDPDALDADRLRAQLGYVPPLDAWEHLVFGRGAADQLAGVVAQIIATKILVELRAEGALHGVTVHGYATVAEEDNDGGGAQAAVRLLLAADAPHRLPDVVVLTEGTGHAEHGALGIYRGQRGRMQIEVAVIGRSCHGSMPELGLNPLEHGAAILAEATDRHRRGEGVTDHPDLGPGTRTASWAELVTPSDCAVPDRFTFRFDRRLTLGESPADAVGAVEHLDAVATARAAGLTVEVRVPRYTDPTWRGHPVDHAQIYPGWLTPADHPAVLAAVDAYRRVVTPHVVEVPGGATGGTLRAAPRVGTWVFSTDGVGYPIPADEAGRVVPPTKAWVTAGELSHPAMIGIGAGIEQNTHRIGEHVDARELVHAIAVLARFPRAFADARRSVGMAR
jgi:putative selenium metabolism hydrolase